MSKRSHRASDGGVARTQNALRVSGALALVAVWAGLAIAPVPLASVLWGGAGGIASAQEPIILAIDMDPYSTPANTCPGDFIHDCTVGSIERCVSVPTVAGTTFAVDALVLLLSNGHANFAWDLAFPDIASSADLTMTAQVETASQVNLISQSVASAPVSWSELVPDAISPHTASTTDLSSSETTPPFTQGTESRMTFTVGAGATPGLYGFSFVPDAYWVGDENGESYSSHTGITVLDSNSVPQYGVLALGMPCPSGVIPVGGIAELPNVSGSSGPPYTALAGIAAPALVALTTGAWYARRRWAR